MDSFSDHPSAFDGPPEAHGAPADPNDLAIGTDERRMHVRAYNYWVSLLDGRDYPSIEDLDPASITDFGPHSVLLDFTAGRDNPATPFIGTAIRAECDLGDDISRIDQVPSRSLLSRLTDHYLQIIANRAPIGFEAEFVNQRDRNICYRGILMPLSSDGDTIDFIYGVINWKDTGDLVPDQSVITPTLPPLEFGSEEAEEALEADGVEVAEIAASEPESGSHIADEFRVPESAPDAPQPDPVAFGDEPHDGLAADDEDEEDAEIALEDDAGLADQLWAARESAEVCKQADGRSRAALYRALDMAYNFAVAARRVPDEYAEILDDAGVKAQARAPMTPIVKLVFGIEYDKTRLTEFAAALSHADRCGIDFGAFKDFIEQAEGGLKGLVAAERKARRPDKPAEDKAELGRARLRQAAALALADLPTNQEFALVVTRRNAAGVHEVVALVSDEAMLDRALRRAAD
ncbi:MAG TPA: hypothetical protein VJ763_08080 [Sphingomicrobium sp.]|nr:hypothetical protein [Sphingomicrobium sp.]